MQITKEQTGDLTAVLKIQFTEEDFKAEVEKTLKDYQRKINMPGFRPGKVPAGMIRKMYGKSVIAEQVDKLLGEGIEKFLQDNEIGILGSPLPSAELNKPLDLDEQKEFEFFFDIGLAPVIDIELNENIQANSYDISVSDEDVDKYIEDLRKKHGKYINPETAGERDIVKGEFAELDDDNQIKPDGIKHSSSVFIEHIPDEETRLSFLGIQAGDTLQVDMKKIAKNDFEISYMLGIKKEEAETLTDHWQFTVESIGRLEPADMDETFFQTIDKNGGIKSEDDLRERIRNEMQNGYKKEAEDRFLADVQNALVKKANIALPDDFLKRFFLETSKDKNLTPEQVEADYSRSSDAIRWQLIEKKLRETHDLGITEADMAEYVKGYFRAISPPHAHEEHQHEESGHEHGHDHSHDHDEESHDHDEKSHDHDEESHEEHQHPHVHEDEEAREQRLDSLAAMILKNEKEARKIYELLADRKIAELFRSKVKVSPKEVTYTEYIKEITK